MIHQPLGGAQGQVSDIVITANHVQKIKEKMTRILAENCGQTYDKVAVDTDRDNYMSAEEAKEYGLIDHIFYKRG